MKGNPKPVNVDRMKAISINRFGNADELEILEVPIPPIKPDEVLIRVHSAGVGVWDAKEREGAFAKMRGDKNPEFPRILGKEASGIVLKAGTDVTKFKEGDKIWVNGSPNPIANLYAEYAVAKEKHVMPIPGNLSMPEAGALPIAGITALTGLDEILNIQNGETVLVFGASGGLGHIAVQLAKAMGANVFAVASGREGVNIVQQLGADKVIDGRSENIIEEARKFVPDGIDTAFLTAGGEATKQVLKTLKEGGRVAYPNGVNPVAEATEGIELKAYNMNSSPEVYKKLNDLIEKRPFNVHIARSFPLEAAAEAHRQLNDHYVGKYVLEVI